MRRAILMVATMALTLLVASGVALAVTKIGTIALCSDIRPLLLRSSGVGVSDVLNPPALCLKANIAEAVQLH